MERQTEMLILIDNYDSFTYNLVHFLGELGATCDVIRNDKISAADVIKKKPKAIVMSPGPCTPNEAGICLELIAKAGGKILENTLLKDKDGNILAVFAVDPDGTRLELVP